MLEIIMDIADVFRYMFRKPLFFLGGSFLRKLT